jgi:hypothetical protein
MTETIPSYSPKRDRPRTQPVEKGDGLFANEIVNHFRLTGGLAATDIRASGTTVITLQCASRLDAPIGKDTDRYTTSRFMIRVPPRVKERFPESVFETPMSLLTVTGRIGGLIEVIDGREYLTTELIATDIKFIARWGAVLMRPSRFLSPVIEQEGEGRRDTQHLIRARLHGLTALDQMYSAPNEEKAASADGQPADAQPAVAQRPEFMADADDAVDTADEGDAD